MAISVDEVTKVISILQADLTLVSGTLYDFDTAQFHLDLRAWEITVPGAWRSITHTHNPEVTVAGITYARVVEIINGYSVTFEDTASAYTVRIINSNNNIFDVDNGVLNPTSLVTVVPTNAAGLIVTGVSGLLPAESARLTLIANLAEADEFFDESAGLLHYYIKGTVTDIIPPKTVVGASATGDTSALE